MKTGEWLLLVLTGIFFFVPIIEHRDFYVRSYNREKMAAMYANSQYVTGSGSQGIGDDGLYAFAGDYMAQAIFGIFNDWEFILTAANAQRQGNSLVQTQVNGNYRVYFINGTLTKRF